MTEISPRKRSAHTEISQIKALLRRPLNYRTLALLSTSDLATYRDERLRSVSLSTVLRELNTISHAIDTAMRDQDVYLQRNPASPCAVRAHLEGATAAYATIVRRHDKLPP